MVIQAREYFQLLHDRLAEGGIYALCMAGRVADEQRLVNERAARAICENRAV